MDPHVVWPIEPIRDHGLTDDELNALATYNRDRALGRLHTLEHQARMAVLQGLFDARRTSGDEGAMS